MNEFYAMKAIVIMEHERAHAHNYRIVKLNKGKLNACSAIAMIFDICV